MEEKTMPNESVYHIEIADIRVSIVRIGDTFETERGKEVTNSDMTSLLKYIHNHADYEMFFVLNGSLRIFTENDSAEYLNKIAVVPPGFNHYSFSKYEPNYVLLFSIHQIPKKENKLYSRLKKFFNGQIRELPLTQNELFYINRLSECFKGEDYWGDSSVLSLFQLLFKEIFKDAMIECENEEETKNAGDAKNNHARYVSIIETYINLKYAEKITLSSLANELYLSTKQVSRIIRREYGCTLSELVNRKRLSVACMLLKNTDMKISEIIKQLNYTSENYFFVLFKQQYGVSPRKFRE